jgi:hypothetical protein
MLGDMVAIGSGLVALVLSVVLWPIVGLAMTVAHEGGHAVTASMMGATVTSYKIERNHNGATSSSRLGPFGAFFMTMAGYLGPSVFGLVGTVLLLHALVHAVLWASIVFLGLGLFPAASWFTRFLLVVLGAIIFAVLHSTGAGFQLFFAYTWVWMLLLGGFGHVLADQASGGMTGNDSDTHQLRKMTYLPRSFWSGFFWLATLIALIYGAGLIFGVFHIDLG